MTKIQKKAPELEGLAVRDLLHQRANELIKNGHSVILHWVPGYSKVEENERADLATKKAAGKGGIETDCWTSTYSCETRAKKN